MAIQTLHQSEGNFGGQVKLLDRAVWRRFQFRLAFPAPDRKHVEVFLVRVISNWPDQPRIGVSKIAEKLGQVSYAEALDFCQNVRRRQILGLGELGIDEVVKSEIDLWSSRVRPEALNAERSEQATAAVDAPSRGGKTPRKTADRTET